MEKYKELLFLKNLKGIGKVTIYKKYWDILQKVHSQDELAEIVKEKESSLSEADIQVAQRETDRIYTIVSKDPEISVITVFDENYPARLNVMKEKRPLILYAKGNTDILNLPNIAVVGTRTPSEWSEKVAERFVRKIFQLSDRVVVSGLALGCDKIAHETTVAEGRKTLAVLPGGVNVITPSSHKNLAGKIIKNNGCLLSEYEPDAKVTKATYVERDAIVAALSDVTFVIECGVKSGTMHTVEYATKYLRKTACYYCNDSRKGSYDGNDYMLRYKGAVKVSDTDELCSLLEMLEK